MHSDQPFTDYYGLLQVNRNCDIRVLEIAYRYFAKMYHPDHVETADPDKFNQVVEAYRVLKDAEKRAEYDRTYDANLGNGATEFSIPSDLEIDEGTALSDAEAHEIILLHLYKRRRENPSDPGVVGWLLQEMLECTDEQFEFHSWYLKAKGYLEMTEQSTLAITVTGVDHVLSMTRSAAAQRLLIGKPNGADGG
ncbi:MAG TPA: DnaJ domain-containing protein [Sphingomonadaceae bacterium]|nr:DnaJ domain-containing protein [Sphingomonadaceae bacterium]